MSFSKGAWSEQTWLREGCIMLDVQAARQAAPHLGLTVVDFDAPLLEGVAVAEGDGAVGESLAINGDAVRGADFILAGIAAADGPLFIVKDVEVGLQGAINLLGNLGHS